MSESQYFTLLGISLIVVRNHEGKWLTINETRGRGWWLPGGKVDPPEDFFTAAKRECKEEAGIDVELKGIIRIENSVSKSGNMRMRVIFYAEPVDRNAKVKDKPDSESLEARWVTLDELVEL
jgi:8-oxo-dGTP pyrophosphatase MutT (NUDIX family)